MEVLRGPQALEEVGKEQASSVGRDMGQCVYKHIQELNDSAFRLPLGGSRLGLARRLRVSLWWC